MELSEPLSQYEEIYKAAIRDSIKESGAKSQKTLLNLIEFDFRNVYFVSEEQGMGIYEKNDAVGTYFPENFYLWIEDHDDEYFEDITELCDYVKGYLGTEKELNTLNDCNEALDEHSEGTGVCFSPAEFEIVDN